MTKGIIIRSNCQIEPFEYTGNYTQLGEIVGGYIEAVNFGNKPYFCYINDEGKLLDFDENKIATELWYNSGQTVLLGDYLAGNVIFFGQVDNEGNDTDYPQELLSDLAKVKL